MALDLLQFQQTNAQAWTAVKNVSGLPKGLTSNNQPSVVGKLGTAAANNAVGGADEEYFALLSLAASGTTTINLQSFTDIVAQATQSLARLKFIRFKLIGSTETAPDGTAGTACSGVTVGLAVSAANLLFMSSATPTFDVNGGAIGQAITFEDFGAAGIAVDNTHKNILITNKDAGLIAKLLVNFVGGST